VDSTLSSIRAPGGGVAEPWHEAFLPEEL
jgi:hypothetical protein